MMKSAKEKLLYAPSSIAGLALGVGSLGWCWENAYTFNGFSKWFTATIACSLLFILFIKFCLHPKQLKSELAHPVIGSVLPTFAMALMIVSHSIGEFNPNVGDGIWLFAIMMHVIFMITFVYHRIKSFKLHHMVPSWFIPPVGIIVADVTFSGRSDLAPIAHVALLFGTAACVVMLPLMFYRLLFTDPIADTEKPTIAILAAPASATLAGYLSLIEQPSPVLVGILFGIAILLTSVIYCAFFRLLRLPFNASFASFTFPMVIGSTALYKLAHWMELQGIPTQYVHQINQLAYFELIIATLVVMYVCTRFVIFYGRFESINKAI
ncbi:C4-dicarboxylate ABC transporter [Photobacterium angustum]|nr:C4-dicarboxylate ABC transporter [Photobacterium angustum]